MRKGAVIRRFGKPPQVGRKYTRRPGAYAILPLGDQYLATFQREPNHETQLPGGGIDPGESPVQALYREVFEETGWQIAYPRRLGVYKRFAYMPDYDMWAEKICHIYLARPVRRLCDPPEVMHQAVWLGYDELENRLSNDGDYHFFTSFARLHHS